MRLFLTTLPEKTQTPAPQKQAAQAVALYCEVWRAQGKVPGSIGAGGLPRQRERLPHTAPLPARGGTRADSLRGQGVPVVPAQGETIAQRRAAAIKTRQYSPKTLTA